MTAENDSKVTFFKNLINRRIPQITGIYLGASWGIVQFVDWIANRYLLSPHLVELTFVILISLAPSIFVMAYFHGMPGRNRWRALEKICVPVNILLTIFLVLFVFKGADFGRISQKVTIQDETGQTIQRVVPKSEYLKKIALFYFDNTSEDSTLDWLQYGILYMLRLDLGQDTFMDVITPAAEGLVDQEHYVLNKIREAGYKKGVGLPLLLKRKIAQEFHKDYFLSGKIRKEQDDFILELAIYHAKNAKQLAKKSFRGKGGDLFQQLDLITVWIKKELDIPASHIEEASDLPLAEMFTQSLAAARSYTLASNAILLENDYSTAQRYLHESLREDPMFTMARLKLADTYTRNNQTEKVPEIYQTVMRQLFKLPERLQLYVKWGYYGTKGELQKQTAVLRMIIKLYPQDIKAYAILAYYLSLNNRYDEAISLFQRILEIDPGRGKAIQSIGSLYESKGDFQQALSYYKTYSQHFPNDPGAFIAIGQLYEKMRDNTQAKSYYEKALLLKPDDIAVLVNLAGIEARSGHFDNAYRQYREALKLSKVPRDKATVYESLAGLCETRGQMKKSLEYNNLRLARMKEYMPPIFMSILTTFSIREYIRAGQEQEALRILETMKQKLKPPVDAFIPLGYLIAHLELENTSEAEALLPDVEKTIEKFGMKKLEFLLHRARGRIQQSKGEYTKAIESFQKGLELLPLDENFMMRIGQCHRALKQHEKAEEILQTTLKREPFHPELNVELALLYLDMKNNEKALNHINVAVEVWKDADEGYKPALSARQTLEQLQQN
jgi:tetratricopeptide (TPR) repeat protein